MKDHAERALGDMRGGTIPLLPVRVGSEARVPKRAVGSAGMGWRGGVVGGGKVVGTSGGTQMDTCTHRHNLKKPTKKRRPKKKNGVKQLKWKTQTALWQIIIR